MIYLLIIILALGSFIYLMIWIFCKVQVAKFNVSLNKEPQVTKSVQEECTHPETFIKVIYTCVNCETTVQACKFCKAELAKPKTDC